MLTALETGVNGGKWFSLVDKVYSLKNLRSAFKRVKANGGGAGVDHQTIAMFERRLEENLNRLRQGLRSGSYRPQAIRRVWIDKPGGEEKRPLGIPTVRDRVVQTALRQVIEPIFERDFAEDSYGFRPGRGCKDALRRVVQLLGEGFFWVVDADLRSYFDSLPKECLLARVEAKISDGRVLGLIQSFLAQAVMEDLESWTPETGTPQGAVISPLLSNLYLDPLDRERSEAGYEMIRYADDFVVRCRSEEEARAALARIEAWMSNAGLSLHREKNRIVDARPVGGFDFLGYHFERGKHWPTRKSLRKFRDAIRAKTRRTNGQSLEAIVVDLDRILRGWFEYYKHSYKTTFPYLDGWIRKRLRSILRKRLKRKGGARGFDHQRWPNAYFAERGLFSLTAAHALAGQSSRR